MLENWKTIPIVWVNELKLVLSSVGILKTATVGQKQT